MKMHEAFSWTVASVVLRYAIKLLGNLTLARLLTPDDFGLSAIVLSVVTGLEAITDVGTRPALIRSHRNDAAWLDTAWTLGLVRGLAIGLALALFAPFLADFFNDSRLTAMIAVTGTMSMLVGLTSITSITAMRDMQMRTMAIVETFAAISGYVAMIGWAWFAPSAWALISGALVSTGTFTVVSYFAFGKRHLRLAWDEEVVRELISFGRWVFLGSLMGFFILQGDRFAVGKFAGITASGIYAIAITWSMSLQSIYQMFLSRLYLPVIARIRRERGEDLGMIQSIRRNVLLAMVIPYAFGSGVSQEIIGLLYPATYSEAGLVLQILVVGAWFGTMEFLYNDQLMLTGKPHSRFLAQIVSVIVISALMFLTRKQLSPAAIAAIFSAGAFVRAIVLIGAISGFNRNEIAPDLGITALFLGLSLALHAGATNLSEHFGQLPSLVMSFIVLLPVGMWLSLHALRKILQQAAPAGAAAGNVTFGITD